MRKPIFKQTEMNATNDIYSGESTERYVRRATSTNQPITGDAPIIYTPRKDGVKDEYNIRADRFEIAQKAMDKVAMSFQAIRTEYLKKNEEKNTKTMTENKGTEIA